MKNGPFKKLQIYNLTWEDNTRKSVLPDTSWTRLWAGNWGCLGHLGRMGRSPRWQRYCGSLWRWLWPHNPLWWLCLWRHIPPHDDPLEWMSRHRSYHQWFHNYRKRNEPSFCYKTLERVCSPERSRLSGRWGCGLCCKIFPDTSCSPQLALGDWIPSGGHEPSRSHN